MVVDNIERMLAHENDIEVLMTSGEPTWKIDKHTQEDGNDIEDVYPTCSHCGSIPASVFIKAMETPGTQYGSTDWKLGFPHKWSLNIPCEPYRALVASHHEKGKIPEYEYDILEHRPHKFFLIHLQDVEEEVLQEWNRVCLPKLGVLMRRTFYGELQWMAPPNYQASGIIE